jgi:hypothetical protein
VNEVTITGITDMPFESRFSQKWMISYSNGETRTVTRLMSTTLPEIELEMAWDDVIRRESFADWNVETIQFGRPPIYVRLQDGGEGMARITHVSFDERDRGYVTLVLDTDEGPLELGSEIYIQDMLSNLKSYGYLYIPLDVHKPFHDLSDVQDEGPHFQTEDDYLEYYETPRYLRRHDRIMNGEITKLGGKMVVLESWVNAQHFAMSKGYPRAPITVIDAVQTVIDSYRDQINDLIREHTAVA